MKHTEVSKKINVIAFLAMIALFFINDIANFIQQFYKSNVGKITLLILTLIIIGITWYKGREAKITKYTLLTEVFSLSNKRGKLVVTQFGILILSVYKLSVGMNLLETLSLILSNSIFLILAVFEDQKVYRKLVTKKKYTNELHNLTYQYILVSEIMILIYILFDLIFLNFVALLACLANNNSISIFLDNFFYFLGKVFIGSFVILWLASANNYIILEILLEIGILEEINES